MRHMHVFDSCRRNAERGRTLCDHWNCAFRKHGHHLLVDRNLQMVGLSIQVRYRRFRKEGLRT